MDVREMPVRIVATRWCIGCKKFFTPEQIAKNEETFEAYEKAHPLESIMFIHRKRCYARLKKLGMVYEAEPAEHGSVFFVD